MSAAVPSPETVEGLAEALYGAHHAGGPARLAATTKLIRDRWHRVAEVALRRLTPDPRMAQLQALFVKSAIAEKGIPSPVEIAEAREALEAFHALAESIVEQLEGALLYAEQEALPAHQRPWTDPEK